jgi:hypothetical protein
MLSAVSCRTQWNYCSLERRVESENRPNASLQPGMRTDDRLIRISGIDGDSEIGPGVSDAGFRELVRRTQFLNPARDHRKLLGEEL